MMIKHGTGHKDENAHFNSHKGIAVKDECMFMHMLIFHNNFVKNFELRNEFNLLFSFHLLLDLFFTLYIFTSIWSGRMFIHVSLHVYNMYLYHQLQAYKNVVNDTSVFRLEIPMKNKG